MEKVHITINDKQLTVSSEQTILQAARENGIEIPTLCNLKKIDPRANCRICLVEVDKFRVPQPACATKVSEGMVIKTNTEKLRKLRKNTLELILADHAVDCHHCLRIGSSKCDDLDKNFCEMCFFCDCVKDGFCELQALAREYKVDVLPYEINADKYVEDTSTGSVIRNANKCIKCRKCLDVCTKVQTVGALAVVGRGSEVKVEPAFGKKLIDSPCIQCGRCVEVCPTGALYLKEHKDEIVYYAHRYDTKTVAQIPENGLEELSALFHAPHGDDAAKRMAAGLRKIGVDYVVSEKTALKNANAKGEKALAKMLDTTDKTIILTNSNSAQKFVAQRFPELKKQVLVYPSSQQEFGAFSKSAIAKKTGMKEENVKTISIITENENAAEAVEHHSVDYVVNARELYRIFLRTGVDIEKIRPCELDEITKRKEKVQELDSLFAPVTWDIQGETKTFDMKWKGNVIKAAVANNLGQAADLLEQVKEGTSPYKVIRIIA